MEKKIAILFMSNRFSQKIGKRINIHHNNINYKTVPINIRKITNPNTIIKKLKEYDYIMVHETDVDIIENLTSLGINFSILKNEYDKYFNKLYSNQYLIKEIKRLLGIVIKTKVYYISCWTDLKSKTDSLDKSLDNNFYFLTPKEALENKIRKYEEDIKYYQKIIDTRKSYIEEIKNKYKEYL